MTTRALTELQSKALAALKKVQRASTPEMAKLLGCKKASANSLMRRLENLDRIYHVVELSGKTNQPTNVYRMGANPYPRDVGANQIQCITRITRTTWPLHNMRDPMVSALFGPAGAA